ncbi:HAD family hydrolase [Streptomyces zhihengii]|uniref:HAD family hydrolase n=1 Tax=Streptomyces zhihengii TaxID=1818004 RepID=UPI00362C4F70
MKNSSTPPPYGLLVLDIDGTLLDTPHLRAWNQALRQVLGPAIANRTHGGLTAYAYQRHVAGRPRDAGARAAFASVGVDPTPALVDRLVTVKQSAFLALASSTVLFPDAARLLDRAAERDIPLAFCTASRNAGTLLRGLLAGHPRAAWLTSRIDRSLGAGGPHPPADRVEAVRRVVRVWETAPERTLVVDDTEHGVAAGLTIGADALLIDRTAHRAPEDTAPRVSTLDEIDLDDWAVPAGKEST